ncbi:MAG: hypothetical protein NTZ72_18845, partial [Afipia sp.]|nr:hypothetical protein [Afipia sp.]
TGDIAGLQMDVVNLPRDAPIFAKAIPLAPKQVMKTFGTLRLITFNEKNAPLADLHVSGLPAFRCLGFSLLRLFPGGLLGKGL